MDDIEDLADQHLDTVEREPRLSVNPKSFARAQKKRARDPIPSEGSSIPGTQSVYVKTWGCSHNNSDGEFMAGQLATYGYQITDDREKADLWVLNSCTVKAPSQEVFLNAVKAGKAQKKPLILAGCVPQGDSKMKIFQGTSLLGVNQIDRIVEVAEETLKGHSVRLMSTRPRKDKVGPQGTLNLPKIRKNPLIEIISINSGCLNQCTYCKTKHARGDLKSYPPSEIVQRAKLAIEEGVREIWLTSEDTGTYGRDIGYSLPRLMRDLIDITPDGVMIKVGMSNPPYFLEYLEPMAEILKHPKVYSVLHVPVQAGSNDVLARMKRKYTVADFRKVVDYLMANVPGMSIHTDIICGFPGETLADWEETLSLIKEYKFPAVHISQFYPRPGTPAAKMERVATHEVKRRSRELSALFNSYATHSHKKGNTYRVLATEVAKDRKHYVAHNKSYDQVLVPMNEGLLGRTFDVKVTETGKFFLKAEIVQSSIEKAPRLPEPLPKGVPSKTEAKWQSPNGKEKRKSKGKQDQQQGKQRIEEIDQEPSKWILIATIIALIAALYVRITTNSGQMMSK